MIQVCYSTPPLKTVHPRRLVLVPVAQKMDPPSAPNPAGDAGVLPEFSTISLQDAPSPPANDEDMDVLTMSRETAMKIIVRSIVAIANSADDVSATPPLSVSRPHTPSGKDNFAAIKGHRRTASRPATPIPAERQKHQPTELDPPEASNDEPTITHDIGHGAQPESVQRLNMARKFFSKTVPKVGVEEYINRIQKYCPLSTAVWLAAGSYILRLCVIDRTVPLTYRTMHRLILACALVAMKALEDHRWPQKRFAAVGGVDEASLSRLELCVEFLLSFDVQIFTPEKLKFLTMQLQRAGQAATMTSKLPSSFHLNLATPKMRQIQT
ncbi:cyclin-domain-containing protein [Phaeosphaeriaceae sp. PMI808]|nr:cyclin-domain-containing protein [Phaeosphaeriaceae sp. PMI808]